MFAAFFLARPLTQHTTLGFMALAAVVGSVGFAQTDQRIADPKVADPVFADPVVADQAPQDEPAAPLSRADLAAESTRELIQTGRQLETNRPLLAAERFDAASKREDLPPNLIRPLQIRAIRLYAAQGELDSASTTLIRLWKSPVDEETIELTRSIASAWVASGDDKAAQRLYRQMASSDLGKQDARIGLAWIECRTSQKPWDACQELLTFAREHPDHVDSVTLRNVAQRELIDSISEHLSSADSLGEQVVEALSLLRKTAAGGHAMTRWLHESRPERSLELARLVLDRQSLRRIDESSRAAARWAGRTQQWSFLSELAELVSAEQILQSSTDSSHLDVARLIAESLVQTGRPASSLPWWRALVNLSPKPTFKMRIRLAEVETAIGNDLTIAKRSIQSARASVDRADSDAAEQYVLVDMVAANLAIRQADFENARYLLEQIVRRAHRTAEIAGNAQWLIGETYSMQGKHHQAIEAYRKVDGIDPSGKNSAAALLQAGRCFEQLGRTRQASICYDHLLSRFGDSPHAAQASQRMASLGTMIR